MAGRPQAHCLAPVTSDYASTICRSSKTLCSPPTTTSQAFSVCISFCFYGFWNNLNSQFIFTKENKITVARPFLGVSLDLLNPATHCLPAKPWVNSLQVTYQRVIESLPTAQEKTKQRLILPCSFISLCVDEHFAHVYVCVPNHGCAWCSLRSEEGFESPGTEVIEE